MSRRAIRAATLVTAFVLLSAGECTGDLFGPIDEPGTIDVTNNSPFERAVVKISTDDAQKYAYLEPGARTSAHTIAGGTYHVRVVMSGSNADAYLKELDDTTGYVEKVLRGTSGLPEQAAAFFRLQTTNEAIAKLEDDVTAECEGTITLDAESPVTVQATISRESEADDWELTCGSNN